MPPLGNVRSLIDSVNVSFVSTILSSIIETLNDRVVSPAGNITSYGPG